MSRVKIDRPKTNEACARRPRHRTTILTTDRRTFNKVRNLKQGETMTVECPNDIVSSARNNRDSIHHSIRRVALLRRQLAGGYRKVRVRWEQGNEFDCLMTGDIIGAIDGCSCKVGVTL